MSKSNSKIWTTGRERDRIDVSFMSVWVYENLPETKKHINSYMVEICWKKIVEVD